ncbi:hypothetical protein AHN10_005035 [Salmonella enterica subsp. enterica]|nr:hypothetical protein [Salmonella enterica subsp. enterica serovar Virginia]
MIISWLPTGCHCQHHRSNNNPRTRGDFFYLNSLRRVLFYLMLEVNSGKTIQSERSV